MMRVWMIRHGESETNRVKYWTGWLDVHLTEKGKEDAAFAGSFLAGKSFDAVYSSDLVRARETASIAIPEKEAITTPLLREINVGNLAGNPISSTDAEKMKLASIEGYAFAGGETKAELIKRITSFRELLEASGHENVAVFTHAGWLRTFLDLTLDTNISRERIACKNCTVAIFEYDGKWKLHSWINSL